MLLNENLFRWSCLRGGTVDDDGRMDELIRAATAEVEPKYRRENLKGNWIRYNSLDIWYDVLPYGWSLTVCVNLSNGMIVGGFLDAALL
jgi:hypothetical protein